mmetsp:Transcript_21479/g.34645  ORF Transcript_21479/g.34645 Transcript_21479/m.34645 type:complete len:103 (-) Transcript_21479:828-1136(-)
MNWYSPRKKRRPRQHGYPYTLALHRQTSLQIAPQGAMIAADGTGRGILSLDKVPIMTFRVRTLDKQSILKGVDGTASQGLPADTAARHRFPTSVQTGEDPWT